MSAWIARARRTLGLVAIAGRRVTFVALVIAIATGTALFVRDRRQPDSPAVTVSPDAIGAAAPSTSTLTPKWYTRRVEVPSELATWSLRISPDGSQIAGLNAQPPSAGQCTSRDKVSPPTCDPGVPSRVLRYALADPPGEITARLTRLGDTPQNGGFAWLPDGSLLVASLDTPAPGSKAAGKTVAVTLIEPDGRARSLGSIDGGSVPSAALSVDRRWLAFGEWLGGVRIIDRTTGTSRSVSLGVSGIIVPPVWSADGRLLIGRDSTLFRVTTAGAVESLPAPDGARLGGVVSVSPDGQIIVFRTIRPQIEGAAAFVDGRWVDLPMDAVRASSFPIWVTRQEVLMRTLTGGLQAFDPRTARTRDLGFSFPSPEPRILAYSEPYLLWRDGDAGRIHLLDTRSAYDALVGTTAVVAAQPYSGGGFLLLHQDGAELLTGADWFARLPPTAAPFASAAPARAGVTDPFADIRSLPRLDQMTTGGALSVVSRSAGSKRVSSPDGGWSLEIPSDWRADVGRLRGGEIYSFDPTGMDYSGNSPPPGGVRLTVLLWPDYEQRGPAWFADHEGQPYPGTTRGRTTVEVAGTTAERLVLRENQPAPFDVPVARWFLRHPAFADRVLEIVLARADAATLAAAEPIIASLQLSVPISGPRDPLLSSSDAIARVVGAGAPKPTPTPAVRERVEAKLVTWKEYELAQASGRGFSLDADTPIWVVVRFGDYEPSPRSMRGPGPFARWTWQFGLIDARTGMGIGGGGGPAGTEPTWWSSLRDRS